jgi:NIPSNAP
MPSIEVPEKKERLFELRCYESPTESAGQKKIEMFNTAGEIDIFKKAGARPVFFGETIIGDRRPNLTYMLCFDNMEAHDTHWKAFGSDPEWKKISTMPEYLDAKLISKITRTFLSPTGYSQV